MHLDVDEFVFPSLAAVVGLATKDNALHYGTEMLGISVGSIPVKSRGSSGYADQIHAGVNNFTLDVPECNVNRGEPEPGAAQRKMCLDHKGRRKILLNGTACLLGTHHTRVCLSYFFLFLRGTSLVATRVEVGSTCSTCTRAHICGTCIYHTGCERSIIKIPPLDILFGANSLQFGPIPTTL